MTGNATCQDLPFYLLLVYLLLMLFALNLQVSSPYISLFPEVTCVLFTFKLLDSLLRCCGILAQFQYYTCIYTTIMKNDSFSLLKVLSKKK